MREVRADNFIHEQRSSFQQLFWGCCCEFNRFIIYVNWRNYSLCVFDLALYVREWDLRVAISLIMWQRVCWQWLMRSYLLYTQSDKDLQQAVYEYVLLYCTQCLSGRSLFLIRISGTLFSTGPHDWCKLDKDDQNIWVCSINESCVMSSK